jgi:hypothetical protein
MTQVLIALVVGVWPFVLFRPSRRATLRLDEETTCAYCGAPAMSFRPIGSSAHLAYCSNTHKRSASRRRQRGLPVARPESVPLPPANVERENCPRPDKHAYGSLEAVQVVINQMRVTGMPRARQMEGYLCACGCWHIGDRRKAPLGSGRGMRPR